MEEFGSVYEGLLEYRPVFMTIEGRTHFDFAQGGQRAATGSHYTPDDLVQPLIKHSLNHLIAEKLKAPDPEKALLALRVADIACGSGHILLAAARRIATELAIVRSGEEQPAPPAMRAAVRDVIHECIFGVDINPLAVELCKVALWLEAHNPGQPLNFLDHHIRCGNAIVGYVRREEVEQGVPDEAFATMPGDDKKIAAGLRQQNKEERRPHKQMKIELAPEIQKQLDTILGKWQAIAALPERSPDDIAAKKKHFVEFNNSGDAWVLNQIAAIPIAQFYLPKTEENQPLFITDEQFQRYWKGERRPQGQATAAAWAISYEKRFFHWFLEFPEIMEKGGFDCILGNPPYLGGQALSGTYGHSFCGYVKWQYKPIGLSDLVVYFVRRIYSLLKPGGFTAIITTNSIKDGDVRKDGLEQVLAQGGAINFAVRGIKWPGLANLVVSLVAVYKGQWPGQRVLDGREVPFISAYFEDHADAGEPKLLRENADRMFQGSIFLGDGFLLTHEEAGRLIEADPCNQDVIFPVINGQEVNSKPCQTPGRSIINFFDWEMEKAQEYEAPFKIIKEKVKPERIANKRIALLPWWLYERARIEIYRSIKMLNHCFVAAATTKYLNFSAASCNYVFLNTLYVFTTDRWDLFAVVQSTLHEVWARKYSGALETRLRYSPSDCFETFPFPEGLWRFDDPNLARIGEQYHEHRRALMRTLQLGLTDIYNLFHTRELTPQKVARTSKQPAAQAEEGFQGIHALRCLHRALDIAVRDAYGWSDLDLCHDFVEVETLPENDRLRYTLSPTARKELLRRLLALNLQRAAEAKAGKTPAKKRARKTKPTDDRQLDLFNDTSWS